MRVLDVQVITHNEYCQLQARVESDTDPDDANWFEAFELWYRFPFWCQPFLSADNGDPFLAALLYPAMSRAERLAIPAPVSPRLIEALPDIQAIYASFDPQSAPVPIEASPRNHSIPTGGRDPGAGLFFSLGVDSFYSLLKNARDHPADARTITHLLSVHGFDVGYEGPDGVFPPALLTNFERVARETNKTLVPVVTNIRRVGVRHVTWPMLHGAAMASIALALTGVLRQVSIAASTTYDRLFPWGSHPVLDPLWSTEALTFAHDGCELNIIDKTGVVAGFPLALETLRPCAGYGPGYNCGRCEKCLRTMLDLQLAGSLGRCRTLPDEIDTGHLRAALRPGGWTHQAEFQRRLDGLEATGAVPEVCAVLREHLAYGPATRFKVRSGMVPDRNEPRGHFVERVLRRIAR